MPDSHVDTPLRQVNKWQAGAALVLSLIAITWLGLACFAVLGVTVITMLYMLSVLWAAYFLRFAYALSTALIAFLLIDYCFIEPRFSFGIGSTQSWVILLVFAILALTVSSVMQQLKQQMLQSRVAAQQSGFFQSLAELLAAQSSTDGLLQAACQHVRDTFALHASVVQRSDEGVLVWLAGEQHQPHTLEASSVQWALDYNRAIGAGTSDWPDLGYCLLPFGFPQREVLVITATESLPALPFLQLLTHQCAQAYTKLCQQIALAQAERSAGEAQFKKTLLTALSHDMRTPLTAILGAVEVLTDRHIALTGDQSEQLLQSIQAETAYLTQATENILTLVKLETATNHLHLDWQSPQEVVAHVISRYQRRSPPVQLKLNMTDEEVLVRMDAVLVAHALANLIDNAIFWRSGHTAIEIALTVDTSWLNLAVINQGPGFPDDFVISAFTPHAPRPAGSRGFGLGLSIVDTIMQLHEGKLEISASSGPVTASAEQRTCVQLRFPFTRAAELMQGHTI
ncbi:MAG: sensor histidine kinase [Methylophilus sp.]|uniref:sensor histidine kinase n=1 Tax=Methylophilus sp. TaxID=29541 RepID=UPI003FA120BE